jgi:hypothetical protein
MESYQSMLMDMPPGLRGKVIAPIRINVPVNLRKFWPSTTLRNFFVSVDPEIDPRFGIWTLEEIIDRSRNYIRLESDRRLLSGRMARSLRGELNPLARIVPLVLKDLILPSLYNSYAERIFTSGLSNLGRVSMPDHLTPHIRRFDFIPPPAAAEKVKASAVGWGSRIHVSFGRLVRPAISELYFFRRLVDLGIPVKIESN